MAAVADPQMVNANPVPVRGSGFEQGAIGGMPASAIPGLMPSLMGGPLNRQTMRGDLVNDPMGQAAGVAVAPPTNPMQPDPRQQGAVGPQGGAGQDPSEADALMQMYQDALNAPVEDRNGRARSALWGGMNVDIPANNQSLGYALGARLGGAASGLIDPRVDEQAERPRELAKMKAAATSAADEEKRRSERTKTAAETADILDRGPRADRQLKSEEERAKQARESAERIAGQNNQRAITIADRTATITEARNQQDQKFREHQQTWKEQQDKIDNDFKAAKNKIDQQKVQQAQDRLNAQFPGKGKKVSEADLRARSQRAGYTDPTDIAEDISKQRDAAIDLGYEVVA